MISSKIQNAINAQIQAEMYSANLYLAMSAYFGAEGLAGFANWMYIQYQEEMLHAMKFFRYLNSRGGRVLIQALEQPEPNYQSVLDVFEKTLAHEQKVTSLIHNLYEIALEEKDYAFQSFLKWYIDEQVEEEETAQGLIDKIKLLGEAKNLYLLDQEMAQRVFAPSASAQA